MHDSEPVPSGGSLGGNAAARKAAAVPPDTILGILPVTGHAVSLQACTDRASRGSFLSSQYITIHSSSGSASADQVPLTQIFPGPCRLLGGSSSASLVINSQSQAIIIPTERCISNATALASCVSSCDAYGINASLSNMGQFAGAHCDNNNTMAHNSCDSSGNNAFVATWYHDKNDNSN